MSGLLPRTTENQQEGTFTNLTVQNLTVSLVGFVNSLVANTVSIGSFVISNLTATTATVTTADVNELNISEDIAIDTAIGQGISLNCTNNAITNNEVAFGKSSAYGGSVGLNLATDETYLWSQNSLKFGTNATERLRIPTAGIALDNAATDVLALQGTTLVSKNNVADTSSAQTLTNKTINSGANTIEISSASGANINDLINQDVRSTASPVFNVIGITAVNNAGIITVPPGGGEFAKISDVQTLTNKTIDSSFNTVQVGGININSLINQDVRSTASPSFATIGIPSVNNGGIITIPPGGGTFAKTTDVQTFINKTINSGSNTIEISAAGNANINTLLNQAVTTTSSPTFPIINNTTLNTNFIDQTATTSTAVLMQRTYLGNALNSVYSVSRTLAASSVGNILLQYPTTTNSAIVIDGTYCAFATTAPGGGGYHFANVFYNSAGVLTNAGVLYNDKREAGGMSFANNTQITFDVSGTNARVLAENNGAYDINITGIINVYQTL